MTDHLALKMIHIFFKKPFFFYIVPCSFLLKLSGFIYLHSATLFGLNPIYVELEDLGISFLNWKSLSTLANFLRVSCLY